jgi:hypothetical protein
VSAPRVLLFVCLVALSPGCLGGPPVVLEDAFAQSEATYDAIAQTYHVRVQGRLANHASEAQRILVVYFAVTEGCNAPKEWPHSVGVENLAAGASTNVRAEFDQGSTRIRGPQLMYRVTADGVQVGSGCGGLAVGT